MALDFNHTNMINGSELRRGNIVSVSSGWVTVEEVFEKKVLVKLRSGETIFLSFESLSPVLLTTKMLTEQLEFYKCGDLSLYGNNFFLVDMGNGTFGAIPGNEIICHLHQLQNIYFEKAKKELTVNS